MVSWIPSLLLTGGVAKLNNLELLLCLTLHLWNAPVTGVCYRVWFLLCWGQVQSFMYTKQAPYQLSYTSSPKKRFLLLFSIQTVYWNGKCSVLWIPETGIWVLICGFLDLTHTPKQMEPFTKGKIPWNWRLHKFLRNSTDHSSPPVRYILIKPLSIL